MLNNKYILRILTILMCLNANTLIIAQPPPTDPPPPLGHDAPIDENIVVLFVIALIFGIYTIYKFKQKQKAIQ